MVIEVKPLQPEKHPHPNEVTEEGMMIEAKPLQSLKQRPPNEVTEEGIVIEVKPLHLEKQSSLKEVIRYSTPSLLITFSGTTISPEYFSVFGIRVAVLAPVSNK